MKIKKTMALILSIILALSSISVMFVATLATKEEEDFIDAVYVGKVGTEHPTFANIFYPLTATKASDSWNETFVEHNSKKENSSKQVHFKLTFKAKMLSGGVYKTTTGLGPVVGYVAYNSANYCSPSINAVNSKRITAIAGKKSYSYDPKTGICEVVFQPVITDLTSDSKGNYGVYGALTIGNAEHGITTGDANVVSENDYDASFIISEPTLYAYDPYTADKDLEANGINADRTYGDNLIEGFDKEHIDFGGSYMIRNSNYSGNDCLLKASRYKWHIDTSERYIKSVKVPKDYCTSTDYDKANFVKVDETDYTREYYTNPNYPGKKFEKLANSDDKAYSLIEDINKKMIILEATHEGYGEGSFGQDRTISNRFANLVIPVNLEQYYQKMSGSNASTPTGHRVILKVTMNAKRLEGNGAPVIGRLYCEGNSAKASNGTSYSYNYDDSDDSSISKNEKNLIKATYNPITGEYVGYVRSYVFDTDNRSTSGRSEFLTIGNAEHKGDNDMFWQTSFNSSFAFSDIKVDLYDSNGDSQLLGLIAEDICPPLYDEYIDTTTARGYKANSRDSALAFNTYDVTVVPQRMWSVDGGAGLVSTHNLSACIKEGHSLMHKELTETSSEQWVCSTCEKIYRDCYGSELFAEGTEYTETQKMIRVKGDGSNPSYVAIPLKVRGFNGTAYYKFSCRVKKNGGNNPKLSVFLGGIHGEIGSVYKDGDTKVIAEEYNEETLTYTAIVQIWRPGQKIWHMSFSYMEPNTGADVLLVLGNSKPVGNGYEASEADFEFSAPQMIRVSGTGLSAKPLDDAKNIIAPITDKTAVINSGYSLSNWQSSYYISEDSPITGLTNMWYGLEGSDLTISDVPDKYFPTNNGLNISNAQGKISTFVTLQSGKPYCFNYKSIYESNKTAKPYIKYYYADGSTEVKYLEYESNVNGIYNTTCNFISAKNLRATKNAQIGIDIDSKEIVGTVSTFEIYQTGSNVVNNLITNGVLDGVEALAPFSLEEQENVFMFEGDIGDTVIKEVDPANDFKIPKPKMVAFEGKNSTSNEATKANDGRPEKGKLSQSFALQKGKKYKLSYNVKYVQTGTDLYEYKLGAQFEFLNGSGNFEEFNIPKVDSDTEYRETYTFELPNGVKENATNFRYTFNFWGAFVSGYIANFTLYELDEGGNTIGNNLFVQGDFANNSFNPGWSRTEWTTYHYFEYGDIPENFFSKTVPYKNKMVFFHNTSDYAGLFVQPMLKEDTNYEFSYDCLITDVIEDKPCYSTGSQFREVDGTITNDSMADSEFTETVDYTTNHYKKTFRTDKVMRMYGNNNMILRFYMRTGASGYWGNFAIYELDEEGNRVSGNIMLDGGFIMDFGIWDGHGDLTNQRFVEIPDNFFTTPQTPTTMVYSNGTGANQIYTANASIKKYTKYYFSMKYIGMNSEGATPHIKYPVYDPDGNIIYKDASLTVAYDSDLYYYEASFTLPEDAISTNGLVNVIVQMDNNDGGKAYFTQLMLAEDGKYNNLLSNFATDSSNYQTMEYNPNVFVFYYDDSMFDDGNWSGERVSYEFDYGSLEGSVIDYDGNELPEITMSLQPTGNKTTLDDSDSYYFTNLAAGTYKLYLSDGKNTLYCTDVKIENGKTYGVPTIIYHGAGFSNDEESSIELEEDDVNLAGYGILNGIYYDRSGKPIRNAKLYISKSKFAVTDKNGKFSFGKLKPNEYGIYVKVGSKFRLLKKVTVNEGKIITTKVMEPAQEESNLWLIILIIAAGVLVVAGAGTATILILKKKAKI